MNVGGGAQPAGVPESGVELETFVTSHKLFIIGTDLMLADSVENRPVSRSEDPLQARYGHHDAVGGNPHNKYVHRKRAPQVPPGLWQLPV